MEVLTIVSLSDAGVRTPVGRTPAVSREHSQLHKFRQDIKVPFFVCFHFVFMKQVMVYCEHIVSAAVAITGYLLFITPGGHDYGYFLNRLIHINCYFT